MGATRSGSSPRRAARCSGRAALSPVSERCVYAGVAEDSIYVSKGAQGRGVGRLLLDELVGRRMPKASGRCRQGSFRRTRHRSGSTNAAAFASSAFASASDSTTASGETSSSWNGDRRRSRDQGRGSRHPRARRDGDRRGRGPDRPCRCHGGRGDRARTPARDHSRIQGANLRVAVPAEGCPDLRRRRRDRATWSPRSPMRRGAATSRATGSSGRRRSGTSRTTGPD